MTLQTFKQYLKRRHPHFFNKYGPAYRLFVRVVGCETPREWLRFGYCRVSHKPYFGAVHAAGQGDVSRHRHLCNIVSAMNRQIGDRPLRILEIGSWAGGSAITWAEAIHTYHRGNGIVVCIDPWRLYAEVCSNEGGVYRKMQKALAGDKIFDLFLHNIRAAGYDRVVFPFRGSSDDVLPLFGEGYFDIVYVDGSHQYASVLNDLRNAAPLVNDGGILCGDDLEMQEHEPYYQAYLGKVLEQDTVFDPGSQRYFHPGVTRAISEFFGEVSEWGGVWGMRRRGSRWEKAQLPQADIARMALPRHLRK